MNTISASNYTQKDLGVFLMEANVQPEKLRAAEIAIFNEIQKVRSHPVTSHELTKARNLIESLYVFNMESMSGQANLLAEYEALGDYHLAEEYLQKLYEVTEEDVIRVASQYLSLTNCSLFEYLPEKSSTEPSNTKSLESTIKSCLHSEAHTDPPMVKKKQPVKDILIYICDSREHRKITGCKLSNGITLLVKETHQIPVVSVGIFAKGGRNHEKSENAGISSLSLRTALKGTQNRTAAQIAYEIENLGSGIQISNSPDFMSFSMNILSKHFYAGLDILADIIKEPVFSAQEIAKEKENIMALIKREKDDMFQNSLKLMYSVLFKKHSYGLPANGTPDSIENISKDDILFWHRNHFTPEKMIEKVTIEDVLMAAKKYFDLERYAVGIIRGK